MSDCFLVETLRDAEVHELHVAAARQHQVVGLDVAMDDAVGVRDGQGAARVPDDLDGFRLAEMAAFEVRAERMPVHELHREVVDGVDAPEVVDLDDVRMVQPSGGAGLLEEALHVPRVLGQLQGERLERDEPVQREIARAVDLPHASGAELLQDLVVAESGAVRNRVGHPWTSGSIRPRAS